MLRDGQARDRLQAAMTLVSELIGGRPVELPGPQRDIEMTAIVQLEAFADWAERITRRIQQQLEPESDDADE